MRVVELEKLTHCKTACALAYRGAAELMARVEQRYPPFRYDIPALAAMDGDTCVGVLLYRKDDDENYVSVAFAYVAPERRGQPVLTRLLSRLRALLKGSVYEAIEFTWHEANADMRKAMRVIGAEVITHTARVPLARPAA